MMKSQSILESTFRCSIEGATPIRSAFQHRKWAEQ
jgi:hypothetical protein